jgi:hypothetical protein
VVWVASWVRHMLNGRGGRLDIAPRPAGSGSPLGVPERATESDAVNIKRDGAAAGAYTHWLVEAHTRELVRPFTCWVVRPFTVRVVRARTVKLVAVSMTGPLYRRVPPHSTTGSPVAQVADPFSPEARSRSHDRANFQREQYHRLLDIKTRLNLIVKRRECCSLAHFGALAVTPGTGSRLVRDMRLASGSLAERSSTVCSQLYGHMCAC